MKKFISCSLSLIMVFSGLAVTRASALNETTTNPPVISTLTTPVLTAYKKFREKFKDVSEISKEIYEIGKLVVIGGAVVVPVIKGFIENKIIHRKAKVKLNTDTVLKNLNEEMDVIKGQDIAKSKIQSTVAGIIDKRNQSKIKQEKYQHGDVILLAGPSGVGKTFSALQIAKAVMGKKTKPVIVDPSDVEVNQYTSIVGSLFNFKEAKSGGNNNSILGIGSFNDTSLTSKIKANPNFVLIINEYDKMHCKELDEVLRSIVDNGTITVSGEKIDCSGLLVILTSNENSQSLKGLAEKIKNSETNEATEDDGTGSRTSVKHDKSFLNRINIIEFDNLDEEGYIDITKYLFKDILEFYKNEYKLDISLSDEAIKAIAEKAVELNNGARTIEKEIINKFREEVTIKRLSDPTGNGYKNTSFIADYDQDEEKFTLIDQTSEPTEKNIAEIQNP